MDTNKVLIKLGYKGRTDFPEIAKWAAKAKWKSEDALRSAVQVKFGDPVGAKEGLNSSPAPYRVFLPPLERIDNLALIQLETALRLPVAIQGAAMPDVHPGYSLPIGGVVALDNAISPAFVGYDIGCQMHLTVFDVSLDDGEIPEEEKQRILQSILASTSFGLGSGQHCEDTVGVMDDPIWDKYKSTKNLKSLAGQQLGSSGSGNHFAEFVVGEAISMFAEQLIGRTAWGGLLTHSGSRGVGNKLGGYYAALADKVAGDKYRVTKGYGWFDLNTELGQEYLEVMQLMGRYARANHTIIHNRFAQASGMQPVAEVASVHNMAWVEPGGVVIHRKGAISAKQKEPGIIPGSCGTASYIVEGLGNSESLQSASHGAGRPYSRTQAKERYYQNDGERRFLDRMSAQGVLHYGVSPDETVEAYKDIEGVIAAQEAAGVLLPAARMLPKVVVMGGGAPSDDGG